MFLDYPCSSIIPAPPLPAITSDNRDLTVFIFGINNRGNVTNETGGDYVIAVCDIVLLASFICDIQTRT